jgi:hypothetical protein
MVIVLLIIGLAIIGLAVAMRQKGMAAASWPSVSGVIVESRVAEDTHDSGCSAVIRYRYQVGVDWHESSQISFNVRANSRVANEGLVRRYPVNEVITVYYNPKSPKEAVINNAQSNGWMLLAAVGVGFLMFGIIGHFIHA